MPAMLQDKVVVITGGTGALGSAVTRAILSAGAVCHVTYRNERDLEGFEKSPNLKFHALDVQSEPRVAEFYSALPSLWASLHLVGGFAMAPIEQTTEADFRKMFDANAVTCFLCCREAIKTMRQGGNGGRIVNVAARPAIVPTSGMIAYSTSKAAVASITQSLADEVKKDGILINAILPSLMDTPANRRAMPNADYSKWPKVEDVAQTILFLASPDNALTTGALVPVFGEV